MSAYPPPKEENAIFNRTDFSTDTDLLTIDEARKYFLTYPVAQGEETFGDIIVEGSVDVKTSIIYPDNTIQTSAYTGATTGVYNSADITIDANGKISSISNGSNISASTVIVQSSNSPFEYYIPFVFGTGANPVLIDVINGLRYNPVSNILTLFQLSGLSGSSLNINAPSNNLNLLTNGIPRISISNTGVANFQFLPTSSASVVASNQLTTKGYVDSVLPNIGTSNLNLNYIPTFVLGSGSQQILVDVIGGMSYNPGLNTLSVPITSTNNVLSTPNTNLILRASGTGDMLFQTAGTTKATLSNSGIMTFDSIPECSVAPTTNNQLTNKLYVDSAITLANANVEIADTNATGFFYPTFVSDTGNVQLFIDKAITPFFINPGTQEFSYSTIIRTANNGVYFGFNAGGVAMNDSCVDLGREAGQITQGTQCIAIGRNAGKTSQGNNAVSIGFNSGNLSQGSNSVAIGINAAQSSQSIESIAIGRNSADSSQGQNCIAIGSFSGRINQGESSIAIGFRSADDNQPANSICLNASGSSFNHTTQGCFINPIVSKSTSSTTPLYYNNTTKEVFHSTYIDIWNDISITTTYTMPANAGKINVYIELAITTMMMPTTFDTHTFEAMINGTGGTARTFDLTCPASKTATFYNMNDNTNSGLVNSISIVLGASERVNFYNIYLGGNVNIYYRIF